MPDPDSLRGQWGHVGVPFFYSLKIERHSPLANLWCQGPMKKWGPPQGKEFMILMKCLQTAALFQYGCHYVFRALTGLQWHLKKTSFDSKTFRLGSKMQTRQRKIDVLWDQIQLGWNGENLLQWTETHKGKKYHEKKKARKTNNWKRK